jgi:hypothetical protein
MITEAQKEIEKNEEGNEGSPPIMGSWRNMYIFVFTNLLVLIILFYLFTKYFQ